MRIFLTVSLTMCLVYEQGYSEEKIPAPVKLSSMVKIDLPTEVELEVLVEYVSKRLGVNLLYDEGIAKKKITLRAVNAIPIESLQGLLETALKSKGLVLIDAEPKGWKRIVDASTLAEFADPLMEDGKIPDGMKPATLAFHLKNIPVTRADQIIKPFLSKPGGTTLVDQEGGVLIVTDFGPNLERIERLLKWIDRGALEKTVKFIPVKHATASELSMQLGQLLQARRRGGGKEGGVGSVVEIASDERTNQLVLIGTPESIQEAVDLLDRLDVPLDVITRTYTFRFAAAERVDRLIQQLIPPSQAKRRYSSAIDQEANLLVVNATLDVHQRIEELKSELDVATAQPQSPIRFYQLKHASVDEVLATIRAIQGTTMTKSAETHHDPLQKVSDQMSTPPGPNAPAGPPGSAPPTPPVQQPPPAAPNEIVSTPNDPKAGVDSMNGIASRLLGQAQVVSDPNTNTIIVLAPPEAQKVYMELIQRLDRRRPQVLIEITIVTINCNEDFVLGIEVSKGSNAPLKQLFAFTSYGLSQMDPATKALSVLPGSGFNGTLVDSAIAGAVLKALTTHSRSKVIAAPRILVDDNATGVLTSVNQYPYSSVNASTTVATTSFGGFSNAGTTLSVTPRIGEGDFLELDINAQLSSFSGGAAPGLPPPRQNNSIESAVTVPDGHTVILGGLRFNNDSKTIKSVPFLEKIPIVKYLVSQYDFVNNETSLYFFIRPVILRDDQFRVLKHFSERDLAASGTAAYPVSSPLLVRRVPTPSNERCVIPESVDDSKEIENPFAPFLTQGDEELELPPGINGWKSSKEANPEELVPTETTVPAEPLLTP
ncbi:hypothetical protein K2Y11_15235 [bacterium]|nr:hypothetical protein [bacterium]